MKKVFWTSVFAFIIMMGAGIICSLLLSTGSLIEVPRLASILIGLMALVFAVSVFALWVHGFWKLLKYKDSRSPGINTILLLFLLFGNIFAAYFMYFADLTDRSEEVIK